MGKQLEPYDGSGAVVARFEGACRCDGRWWDARFFRIVSPVQDTLARELADRYTIDRELGRGGMATVWLARDLRHDRSVALKVIHPELAGAIGIDRFVREVRLTARLQHQNIVPVLESGTLTAQDGSRLPWYTMPYIAGESLRSRLRREGQLPIDAALRITRDVAAALHAAHQQGIVHRDIKPENVLLTDSVAYVVDFGVAKALSGTGEDRLTATGFSIGTPVYMSPEQASARDVDARSDQYSLGCVLYEMLSGEPPFTGPTAQAIIARRFAEPARPLRPVRSTVPVPVEQALLRALERSPVDRFDSVASFAAALSAGTHASHPGGRRIRRAGALLMLVLAGSILGAWLFLRPQAAVGRAATSPEVLALYSRGMQGYNKRTTAGAQEAMVAFNAALRLDSTYAPAWNGLARNYVQAHRRQFTIPGIRRDSMLRLAVAAADRAIATDPGSADTWLTRAEVGRSLDPTDVRAPILASRRAIELDSGNGPAWHHLAVSLADSGDVPAALEGWREAVKRNPSYAQGIAFLAMGHYWRRQFDSAAAWADSAVALDPSYLLGRTTVGFIAVERGDHGRAIAAFEAAGRLSSNVEVIEVLAGLALARARQGDRAGARLLLGRADSLAGSYEAVTHTIVYLAQANAALGNAGPSIAWLNRHAARSDRHFQLHLRCDPPFDPIAGDPRFQALLLEPRPGGGQGC